MRIDQEHGFGEIAQGRFNLGEVATLLAAGFRVRFHDGFQRLLQPDQMIAAGQGVVGAEKIWFTYFGGGGQVPQPTTQAVQPPGKKRGGDGEKQGQKLPHEEEF